MSKPERWSPKWWADRTIAVDYELQDRADGRYHIRTDDCGVVETEWADEYAVMLRVREAERVKQALRLLKAEVKAARERDQASAAFHKCATRKTQDCLGVRGCALKAARKATDAAGLLGEMSDTMKTGTLLDGFQARADAEAGALDGVDPTTLRDD